ncbi:MAG: bifunctional 4-hydroxy-2-oxoglutarate aldolase/2-dehydro-3-deoxy-phosphogluconate aldolase [Planctomycetes bacterium]|nr:bifunctional 4-hydroxy-2-oxoglutarate aldolase/2-dehydro-3-deoxy-phosphogluconate aldolase [Planctomycetota bacterium]MCH9723571.1 bifunctional 4-hydroxy-2-oxoglutarate aldolase/2-dehydro-3-deoxy-phosphogluconate aldolase [Planctomycetota bacterium]MCH9775130.1 bifunctional 4-hydroxy-2-oxoglutarate aldolase/2-dehydro-3-deoxy-phosphogluconate aldolase [Planctomycetota bacterium]MCH9793336.1 bifunctional 4-hydroxy-2-oxoglutarate aldolase/2-dehydro-3-deoxy-phosphogluconate aldolase [Planctomycet
MSRHADFAQVIDRGAVAIIRAPSGELLVDVSKAIYAGGLDVIEVTFTVPGVLDILAQVKRELGDKILLGAGTVLDSETARAAILAGAEFIVTPTVNTEVIELCNRYDKLVMTGALTPTELLTAWEAGADIIKVFPAFVGGPEYLKALHGPLPQIPLMPTGGVDLETLPDYLHAGACAVGLGSSLVTKQMVETGDLDGIQNLTTEYMNKITQLRKS